MSTTARRARRGAAASFAVSVATVVGAFAVTESNAPSATASSDPCAASEVARTVGSAATSIGNYLDTHPETNQALTTISQQQPGPQSLGAVKTYFDANPQAGKDMQQLQAPLVVPATRCKLPLTLPQVLGLMQAAQFQATSLPGGLPGAVPTAQTAAVPGAVLPAQPRSPAAGTRVSGPLPGPSPMAAG